MKRLCVNKRVAVALLFLVAASGQVNAQRPPGVPPAQAIDACVPRTSGEVCGFSDRGEAISGICQRKLGKLVCVPDRPPPGSRGDARSAPGDTSEAGSSRTSHADPKSLGPSRLPSDASGVSSQPRTLSEGSDALSRWNSKSKDTEAFGGSGSSREDAEALDRSRSSSQDAEISGRLPAAQMPAGQETPQRSHSASRADPGPVPPKEAIDACVGKAPRVDCVVRTPRDRVVGVCAFSAGELACIPREPPR
jgi:hypothetical protein